MAEELRDPPIIGPPIRLAVCVSGEGTTLQNLIDRIRSRKLRAEIVQVVASRPRIGAIARAEAARIPLALANYHARSNAEFSASVFDPIRHSRLGPGHPGRLPVAARNPARLQGPSDQRPSRRSSPPFAARAFTGRRSTRPSSNRA